MPSADYRYYCLDRTGKLHDTQWFAADSDEDAVAQIQAKHPDSMCEIWQGQRLVAKIGSTHSAAITSSRHAMDRSLQALRDTAHMGPEPGRPTAS